MPVDTSVTLTTLSVVSISLLIYVSSRNKHESLEQQKSDFMLFSTRKQILLQPAPFRRLKALSSSCFSKSHFSGPLLNCVFNTRFNTLPNFTFSTKDALKMKNFWHSRVTLSFLRNTLVLGLG